MTESSIVDRQSLDHLLTSEFRPISEQLEVLVLTNTEAVL